MSAFVATMVYPIDKLSDDAKDRARAWYREIGIGDDWYEFVFEDFEAICAILGVRLKTSPVRLFGGGTRQKPRLYYQGFWSQGDGACFEAFYAYEKNTLGKIREHAPEDTELHRIAVALQAIQRRNFYQLRAETVHRGHYCHAFCMAISVGRDGPACQAMTADAEDAIAEALRDLAHWLYRQLEREYEYQTSDAVVDAAIRMNDYTFTASGDRMG